MERDELFAQFLLDAGLLSRAQLAAALSSGHTLAQGLVVGGYLTEEEVVRALAKSLAIPFVVLAPEDISLEALSTIPEAFSRAHEIVAYKKEGNTLHLALLNPNAFDALASLALPYRCKIRLTNRESLKRALLVYQDALKKEYVLGLASHHAPETMVDSLLLHALAQRARTVHLEPRAHGLLVRYRLAEELHDAMLLPPAASEKVLARLRELAKISVGTKGAPKTEGVFTLMHREGGATAKAHIQVLAAAQKDGALTLHLVSEGEGRLGATLESIGFHGAGLTTAHRALARRSGLILVSGKRKSSITSALYTLTDVAVTPERKIVSVEEHVSVLLPGVTQLQSDQERGITLADRLRVAFKHDPDIIMVSDIADPEVATLALHAANRGMLVVAGVQASRVTQALETLHELVGGPLLSAVFVLGLEVRLAEKLCAHALPSRLTHEQVETLEANNFRFEKVVATLVDEGKIPPSAQWNALEFKEPIGCAECTGGFSGMVGIIEFLPATAVLTQALRGVFAEEEVERAAQEELSFLEDGMYKAALGLTTPDEVLLSAL